MYIPYVIVVLGRLFSSVEDNNSIDLLDKVLRTRSVTFFHGNCSCKICNQIWQPYKFLLPSSWLLGAHASIHYRSTFHRLHRREWRCVCDDFEFFLQKFFVDEEIDWFCPRCKKNVKAALATLSLIHHIIELCEVQFPLWS